MNFLTRCGLALLFITLAAIVADASPARGAQAVYDVTLSP